MRDLVVKSSMQESKQRSTRPENICGGYVSGYVGDGMIDGGGGRCLDLMVRLEGVPGIEDELGERGRWGWTYVHELLHLLALHARLEFALLRGIESESARERVLESAM